jgi:hypothetical protein
MGSDDDDDALLSPWSRRWLPHMLASERSPWRLRAWSVRSIRIGQP